MLKKVNLILLYVLTIAFIVFAVADVYYITRSETRILQKISELTKEVRNFDYHTVQFRDNKECAKYLDANVEIYNTTASAKGAGTHIKIQDVSYVLSCAHLLKDDSDVMTAYDNDRNTYILVLVEQNKDMDLALFKILFAGNLPYLELGQNEPPIGSEVLIVGNPNGFTDIITSGLISQYYQDGYLVENKVYFGNSGGALIYKDQIVGVLNSLYSVSHDNVTISYGHAIGLPIIEDFLRGYYGE